MHQALKDHDDAKRLLESIKERINGKHAYIDPLKAELHAIIEYNAKYKTLTEHQIQFFHLLQSLRLPEMKTDFGTIAEGLRKMRQMAQLVIDYAALSQQNEPKLEELCKIINEHFKQEFEPLSEEEHKQLTEALEMVDKFNRGEN
jgi:hypothetical protein